jgi:hypothetical protein
VDINVIYVVFWHCHLRCFLVAERIEEMWNKFNFRINGLHRSGSVRVLSRLVTLLYCIFLETKQEFGI